MIEQNVPLNIEDEDIAAAQTQLITDLINENLRLRATINRIAREQRAQDADNS